MLDSDLRAAPQLLRHTHASRAGFRSAQRHSSATHTRCAESFAVGTAAINLIRTLVERCNLLQKRLRLLPPRGCLRCHLRRPLLRNHQCLRRRQLVNTLPELLPVRIIAAERTQCPLSRGETGE